MSLVFDLDGTLTDPGDGFVACVSHALQRLGCRPCGDAEIRRHVGPPLQETLARLIEDRTKLADAIALYRERYASEGLFQCRVYPGIEDALGILYSRTNLFVATSKPTVYAERILEHFGLRRFFGGVYGSELDGTRSDKTQLLFHVLESENLTPRNTIMIGDRAQDMLAARAAGMRPVGALWGYGSRHELEAAGAALLCERPADVPVECHA